MKSTYILGVVLIGLVSCTNEVKEKTEEQRIIKQEKVVEKEVLFKVEKNNFLGIQPNDRIEDHKEALQKGRVRDGKNILEVYNIEINGKELGYLLPHSDDKKLVGNIILQSDKIEMDNEVRVGMSFSMLKGKYDNLIIQSSEKEGEFYAKVEGFRFRLRHKKTFGENENPDKANISAIIILEK